MSVLISQGRVVRGFLKAQPGRLCQAEPIRKLLLSKLLHRLLLRSRRESLGHFASSILHTRSIAWHTLPVIFH